MYVTRQELRDLLEVNENTLKSIIKRGTLSQRIEQINYTLIGQCKIGRISVYEIEPIERDLWSELQSYYKIRKREEHTKYSKHRLEDGMSKSRSNIIKDTELNISPTTAKKFDEILVNENAIKKGPVAYRLLNKKTNELTEITREEYLQWWSSKKCSKDIITTAKSKRKKFLISERDYDNYISMATQQAEENDEFAYCFDTYVALQDAERILEMIRNSKK